jgi:hypothetical protein
MDGRKNEEMGAAGHEAVRKTDFDNDKDRKSADVEATEATTAPDSM